MHKTCELQLDEIEDVRRKKTIPNNLSKIILRPKKL